MNRYIKHTTNGQTIILNQKEAESFASTPNDQSITFNRIEACIQRRFWDLMPLNNSDMIFDRKKQQTGRLHDGSRVKKNFGYWGPDSGDVPDDKGNYSAVKLDPRYYPEVALDIVATEDEWQEIQKTGKNYYEFLSISDKVKRLGKKEGFTKLLE